MGHYLFPVLAGLWTIYMIVMYLYYAGVSAGKSEEETEKTSAILTGVGGFITALYAYNVVENFHAGGNLLPNWSVIGAFLASVLVVLYIMKLNIFDIKTYQREKNMDGLKKVKRLSWILTIISAGIMYVHVIVFNIMLGV